MRCRVKEEDNIFLMLTRYAKHECEGLRGFLVEHAHESNYTVGGGRHIEKGVYNCRDERFRPETEFMSTMLERRREIQTMPMRITETKQNRPKTGFPKVQLT